MKDWEAIDVSVIDKPPMWIVWSVVSKNWRHYVEEWDWWGWVD